MGSFIVVIAAVLLLLPAPAVASVTLHFTFGLTRQAETCWEEGDRLKYRVGGRTYDVAKTEVARIEGECAPTTVEVPGSTLPLTGTPVALEPTDAMLEAGRVSLPIPSWQPPSGRGCYLRTSTPVTLRRVIDGDTIQVAMADGHLEVVRYIGMNTPEVHHPDKGEEPGGRAAKAVNETLVRGKRLELAFDMQTRDRYGRLLAYVWANGEHVNAAIVERGYANAATFPPNVCLAERFRRLEREAHTAGRGLWEDPTGQATMVANQESGTPDGAAAGTDSSTSSQGTYTSTPAPSDRNHGPVQVQGYTRKDGTYVAPHTRSAPGTKGGSGRR
jgi:micrococcal nuclease